MNWKRLVEKQNAATYVLPPGWDSRDAVAESLECAPERVADFMRPCLTAHTVEKRDFIVWDDQLKQKVRITAYRQIAQRDGEAPSTSGAWDDETAKKAKSLHAAGKSYAEIGKALGRSKDSVRNYLRRLK